MALALAPILAVVFTLLISPIEIRFRAKKADPTDLLGSAFVFYVAILAIGNVVASLLALAIMAGRLPEALTNVTPLLAAFGGVFAFQVLLSNTNVTFFGKGVLAIDDWIEKARSSAVESAIEAHAKRQQDADLQAARALADLSDGDLNSLLLKAVGQPRILEIEHEVAQSGASPKFYKALILASEHSSTAAAVLRAQRRSTVAGGLVQRTAAWERIAIFLFGVVFVVVILVLVVIVPCPTPLQVWVFRVVLALAAAGVAALIPGFLNLTSRLLRNTVRAGGALAVFWIIYSVNPPALVAEDSRCASSPVQSLASPSPAMSPMASARKLCTDKDWNHGTLQSITRDAIPLAATIIRTDINVGPVGGPEYPGVCPANPPQPPTVANYTQRQW